MPTRRRIAVLAGLSFSVLAGACRDVTAPPLPSEARPHPLGLVEVTISGVGSDRPTASARVPAPTSAGARWSLSVPANGNATGNGSIQLQPLTTASFTTGERSAGGYRYLWATFRVRNAQTDGTPYDTPRQNLTFFAVSTAGTLGGTTISSISRFDGSAAAPGIASSVVPTGLVSLSPFLSAPVSTSADVLQVLNEAEALAVPVMPGATLLPYGFVVRSTTGGRTLGASPAPNQYDGVVTFAFKLPLQATAAEDPFSLSMLFQAVDDSETRLTQSLEEQTPAGGAAFVARAAQIGATMKTALPGPGSYGGDAATTRTLCAVRIAGTSASPTAYLVNQSIASIQFADPFPGRPLWASGAVARRIAEARDAGGAAVPSVPVQMSFGTPGVFRPWGSGGISMVGRRNRATSTVTGTACGLSATSTPLASSGFSPLSGGDYVTVALRSDGTVAAWGANLYQQVAIPPGLTGVVQVAAAYEHALALKSDGTVVWWGMDNYGQTPMPPGLAGIVQIAVGSYHSVALKSDGTVVAWGYWGDGQTAVPSELTGVVQVTAGVAHSVALKSDGTVVAWGDNSAGQTTVPGGLTGVVQVAAADMYTIALKGDGTLVAWGTDPQGNPPTVPPGLTGVVQVAAGYKHMLALKSDGTVVAWGTNNLFGQTTVPSGLTGVVQIAAGTYHSLAVRSDGTVVAWGDNNWGQSTVPSGLVATVP